MPVNANRFWHWDEKFGVLNTHAYNKMLITSMTDCNEETGKHLLLLCISFKTFFGKTSPNDAVALNRTTFSSRIYGDKSLSNVTNGSCTTLSPTTPLCLVSNFYKQLRSKKTHTHTTYTSTTSWNRSTSFVLMDGLRNYCHRTSRIMCKSILINCQLKVGCGSSGSTWSGEMGRTIVSI